MSENTSAKCKDINRLIGRRVFDARRMQGIERTDLAELLGITKQQMGKLERGEVAFKVDRLIAVADHMGIAPSVFVDSLNSENSNDHHAALLHLIMDKTSNAELRHIETILNLMLDLPGRNSD